MISISHWGLHEGLTPSNFKHEVRSDGSITTSWYDEWGHLQFENNRPLSQYKSKFKSKDEDKNG